VLARFAGCALPMPPDPRRRTLTRAAPALLLARCARSGRAERGEAALGNLYEVVPGAFRGAGRRHKGDGRPSVHCGAL